MKKLDLGGTGVKLREVMSNQGKWLIRTGGGGRRVSCLSVEGVIDLNCRNENIPRYSH